MDVMQQLPIVTNGAPINCRQPKPIINPPPITPHGMTPLMLRHPIANNAIAVMMSAAHATATLILGLALQQFLLPVFKQAT